MARRLARKGDTVGWWDPDTRTFTEASPGVAYQIRCTRNVEEREARSWYTVVGYVR